MTTQDIAEAVARINAIDTSDPEHARGQLEDILLELAPREVRVAAAKLVGRCRWWGCV